MRITGMIVQAGSHGAAATWTGPAAAVGSKRAAATQLPGSGRSPARRPTAAVAVAAAAPPAAASQTQGDLTYWTVSCRLYPK